MSVTIKFRRGTSAEWASNGSAILASGEPGYELDTGRFKIGNGVTAWSGLSYASVIPTGFLAGSGVSINLGSNGASATIGVSGLNSSYISDFNSAVSGLLPVKDILSGTGISVTSVSGTYTITSTGSGILADQSKSLVTTVFNKTASTIPKMSAVYINGGQGDQPTIQLAIATGDATSAGTYGLTYEPISSMSAGKVIVFGALTGLNTDQFNPTAPTGNVNGSVVYLSPTTSGTLTTTKPHAPDHIVAIGTIVRTHQNEGVIEVRVQNGFELEELHNVAATGASNNQAIIYNSASGLWMNTTLTSSLISDFNEAVDDRIGSGLFAAGTGINLNYNDGSNSFTVSVTGLISNPSGNRILTSRDNTTTGIDAESNLTFDGSLLSVSGNILAQEIHLYNGSSTILTGTNTEERNISFPDSDGTVVVKDGSSAVTDLTSVTLYATTLTTQSTNTYTINLPAADGTLVIVDSSNGQVNPGAQIYATDFLGVTSTNGTASFDGTALDNTYAYTLPNKNGTLITEDNNGVVAITTRVEAPTFTANTSFELYNGASYLILSTTGTTTRNVSFPDADGTVMVVDAGGIYHPITTSYFGVNGAIDAGGNYIQGGEFRFYGGGISDTYLQHSASTNRTITIPDADGTVVLYDASNITNLPGDLNVTGSGIFSSGLNIANQTENTIASFDGSKNVVSLSTGTYPSLTELSYVKDVTSAIQTQINAKQNTLTNPVTGTGVANHIAYWNSSSGIVADSGQLYWDATNNRLGVGTASPSSSLTVSGIIQLTDTAGNRVQFFRGGGTQYDYSMGKEGNHLAISTANDGSTFRYTQFGYHSGATWTPTTVINNYNGYVGIGTTTPTAHLQVVGTGRFTNIDINNSAIAGTSALTVNGSISTQSQSIIAGQFAMYGDGNTVLHKANASTFAMSVSNSGYKHSFGWNSLGTHIPWAIISSSGVGIGTSSPSYNLDVVGTGNFSQNLLVNGVSVSVSGHTHTASQITDFNEAVDDRIGSGLFVAGTGIGLFYDDTANSFNVSVTGLINNPTNNRILTSRDSTTTGIDAESNLTFDGTNLVITSGVTASTGNFSVSITGALLNIDNIRIDGNTISSTNASGSIIINPSGNGSLQRDSEGNTRGIYAVDWQTVRSTGTMVAAGAWSVIGGGRNNSVGDQDTFVGGGKNNTASNYSSAVVGGESNTVSGARSVICGGTNNSITSNRGFIGGGSSNISSGSSSVVVGGQNNRAASLYSVVCGGGYDLSVIGGNIASGIYSFIGGGKGNRTNNQYSSILGGQYNTANHNNVVILGSNITSTQADTTYVQNLDVSITGDIDTLRINKFYHNNLSVATGVADSDLLITIVDPTGTSSTQVISGSGLRNSLLNQPAVLRFRQGTDAERLLITPASGEPIWTTDTQQFYIGDGSTVGGDFMGPSPYARSSGTQSIVALNTGCAVTGDYSVVGGGYQNTVNGDGSVIAGGGWYNAGSMQIEANTISSNRSFIGGGANNTITTDVAVICGGRTNSIGGYAILCSILGGYNNSITANVGCSILGGMNNNISGSYSSYNSICGGRDNSMTAGATSAVIGGGAFNTSSGYYSVIGGGTSNTIAGDRYYNTIGGGFSNYIDSQGYHASTIAGGYQNTISNDYSGGSTIGGGHYNTITSNGTSLTPFFSCIPGGLEAKVTRYGELSHSAGKFANDGDAQHTVLIARRTTTDATANQILYLDNSSLKLILPAETTWTFTVKLSAYNDTDNQGGWWIFRGGIRRNAANGTTLIGSLITESGTESSLTTASASVVADDTNEALQIRVTGVASKNIRWVAVVDISQVSYGTP